MRAFPERFRPLAGVLFGRNNRQALFALGSLFYLVFLFLPIFVPHLARSRWLLATVFSVMLFLPLYVAVWRMQRPWRDLATLAIALLGFALLPYNVSSNTYVIYTAAVLGGAFPLRQAVPAVVLTLAAFVAWHLHWQLPLVMAVMTCLLAIAVFIGNAIGAAYARTDVALKLSQDDVRQLARVAERERIGRDLHDLLGHTLSVIVLKAELANRLYEKDRDAARREIADVERIARETLGQVRRAVTGIRAAGLRAELVSARLGLDAVGVDLDFEGEVDDLPPSRETVLALVLREAVTNIVRHAGANQTTVRLLRNGREIVFSISDNGHGGKLIAGTGLTGMRERVEAAGGTLDWHGDANGTRIVVRLPVHEATAELLTGAIAPS